MTKTILLNAICERTKELVKELRYPVPPQKGELQQPADRAPDVYAMRLPSSSAYKKKVPYIIHQLVTGKDAQEMGQLPKSRAVLRTIFCVYHEDEQEGSILLLNLMEKFRISLLKNPNAANQFDLDLQTGIESAIYPDDLAPFYGGEIVTEWNLPSIQREDARPWN